MIWPVFKSIVLVIVLYSVILSDAFLPIILPILKATIGIAKNNKTFVIAFIINNDLLKEAVLMVLLLSFNSDVNELYLFVIVLTFYRSKYDLPYLTPEDFGVFVGPDLSNLNLETGVTRNY